MLLRFAYLSAANVSALLRLLPGSDPDKDTEILVLRHQITVLQPQPGTNRPGFSPADRGFPAALPHRLPHDVLCQYRLLAAGDCAAKPRN